MNKELVRKLSLLRDWLLIPVQERNEDTGYNYISVVEQVLALLDRSTDLKPTFPIIHLCSMKESNGKETWIVMMTKTKEESVFRGLQIYSDSIKGRAEYEADRLRYFFDQRSEPDILKYDTK